MAENERLEYKKSLAELKDGLISIAAILNKHGEGELWFGLRNDGSIAGLFVNEKTLRDIAQAIAAHIEPKIFPFIGVERMEGKDCVKIAFSGGELPYFAYGRAYMRVADSDRQLSAKELESIILEKNQETLRWDNKTSAATLDDLDEGKVKRFLELAGLKWDSLPNALEKLGVLRQGRLLNAAPLFFGRVPPLQLRCAVFATSTSSTIIDRHDYEGDILELIEEAQKYVLKNIRIGMRLKGLYRVDTPEISIAALREAVINAFCHRDFRDPEEVRVAIFKDRVEIRNPGELFGGLTIHDLRKGNVSKRRNPLIADLLRRIHMVEGWGRGMPLILEEEPEVKFREVAQIFITDFIRPLSDEDEESAAKTDTIIGTIPGIETKTDTIIGTIPGIETKTSAKIAPIPGIETKIGTIIGTIPEIEPKAGTIIGTIPEIMPKSDMKIGTIVLSEVDKAIIEVLREQPLISLQRLGDRLNMSYRAVRYRVEQLKAKGLIKRVGTKNGHWELKI